MDKNFNHKRKYFKYKSKYKKKNIIQYGEFALINDLDELRMLRTMQTEISVYFSRSFNHPII